MKLKNIISISVIIITLSLLIIYINSNLRDFINVISQVSSENLWLLGVIAITTLLNLYVTGILLYYLMQPFKIKLTKREAFSLSIITRFYNLITPFHGGAITRAVYLKKKYSFPYVSFLATLSAIYIIIFLVASLIATLTLLSLKQYNIILTLLIISTLFFLLIIIFSPKIKETKNKWLNRFIKVINGWHLIKNNKKIISITIIISILQIVLTSLSILISYHIFNINLTMIQALFIASISNLSIIVSLTPGNLGIGDAINVLMANLIGIGLTEAIAATILGRAVNLAVIFILGPIFSYYLMKK